jgi:hypothetical protein
MAGLQENLLSISTGFRVRAWKRAFCTPALKRQGCGLSPLTVLAQALPDCRAHFIPEEGHISVAYNYMDDFLREMLR